MNRKISVTMRTSETLEILTSLIHAINPDVDNSVLLVDRVERGIETP